MAESTIIRKATYLISNADWQKCPDPGLPEYAFIGRSNVGKSTLINMLTGRHNLARISGAPGKTRTINHYLIDDSWYLVDLPGYGYARVSAGQRKQWEEMIRLYLCNRPNLMMVFQLIDSRLEPQASDLNFTAQLGEWRIPFVLLFTKSDKVKPVQLSAHVTGYLDRLKINWQELPAHIITSGPKKTGREDILQRITAWNKDFRVR